MRIYRPALTVEKVLAGFNKTLNQLDTVIAQAEERRAGNAAERERLMQEESQLASEQQRAIRARRNIENLIKE